MSEIIDLSRPIEPGMPHARTIPDISITPTRTWDEHRMRALQISMPTHIGTHLDAPSHFVEGGRTLDDVPLSMLIGRAYCVEVLRAEPEAVETADLEEALARNGVELLAGDALLIRTGWDERYDTEAYIDDHAWLAPDAARWCAEKKLRLVGMDTITPEFPMGRREPGYQHEVHWNLLRAGTLIIENLDLKQIPDCWVTLFVGALKVTGGDGAPARVLAIAE